MSVNPPPTHLLPIFNPIEYNFSSTALTIALADQRYLRLTGGTLSGICTFNAGVNIVGSAYYFSGSFNAALSFSGSSNVSIALPTTSGTLAITSQTVNLTGNQTVAGTKTFSSPIIETDSTASTSSSTGSLQVAGGAYFGNDSIFNTQITVPTIKNGTFVGTMPSSSADNGTFITSASTPTFSGQCTFTYHGGSSLADSTIYVNPSSFATGVVSNWYYTAFKDPNISSGTVTTASTVYIAGAPTGGTITNAYALNVASGTALFQGALRTGNLQLLNGANIASVAFAGGSSVTLNMPTVTSYIVGAKKSFPTQESEGITLKDAQTITTAANLLGATFNADSTTYTDSVTAASGTVAQVADFVIGQRTWNCTNTGVTYTSASSLRVMGPPIAGTNCTISTATAIRVDTGNIRLVSGQIISIGSGTATNPVYTVGGATGLGMYSSAANTLSFSVSSGSRLNLTGGACSPQVVIRNVSGTQAAPSYSYSIDAATGIWIIGAGNMGVSCSNTKLLDWSSTAMGISIAGSAATPSLYWSTDSGSGLYRPAANQLGITISGSAVGNWASTGLTVTGNIKSNSGYYVGNTTFNSQADSLVVTSNANTTTSTATIQISPATTGWASTGTAQIYFGDANHKISVVNGTGMTITDSDGIKFAPGGSIFKQMNRSVTELTAPGANFATYTIAHGLGTTPIHAEGTIDKNGFPVNNDCFSVTIQSWNSSNIVWQVARVDTNSNWGNNYNLRWMAWA